MSLWQFAAAVDGYNRIQAGSRAAEAPSDDAYDRMIRDYEEQQHGH